jgi:flagellar basal body-associated protein FliL
MKHVVSAVVAVVCILIGGITGHFVKTGLSAAASPNAHEKPEKSGASHGASDSHGAEKKKDSHGAKKESSGHGGGGHGDGATGDVVYFKFTREFIVPIMHDRKVESLVILNINLEADSSVSQKLFSMEPKIRDNIMTTLIELSNDDRTFDNITDVESYETIRAMVLMNLQKAVPAGIQNVLIVDIAQQDL